MWLIFVRMPEQMAQLVTSYRFEPHGNEDFLGTYQNRGSTMFLPRETNSPLTVIAAALASLVSRVKLPKQKFSFFNTQYKETQQREYPVFS